MTPLDVTVPIRYTKGLLLEKKHRNVNCGKVFTSSSYIEVHERLHTGETTYVSNHCGKAFLSLTYIQNIKVFTIGRNPISVSNVGIPSFL
jgi:uncharacterized Zn-finger protein